MKERRSRSRRIDDILKYHVTPYKKRSLWFRKCHISQKPLFMKKSYKIVRLIHGPGFPVELVYWVDAKEFFMLQLTGRLENGNHDTWDHP